MSDDRNFADDTTDWYDQESAMPFASAAPADPHAKASWGDTGDAAFDATAMACTVETDGSVTTHAKAGQANAAGAGTNPAV